MIKLLEKSNFPDGSAGDTLGLPTTGNEYIVEMSLPSVHQVYKAMEIINQNFLF